MKLGWKVLIPGALGWTLLVATIRVWRRYGGSTGVYLVTGAIVIVALALLLASEVSAQRAQQRAQAEAEAGADAAGELPAGQPGWPAGAFPVPPMDLPHYRGIGVTAGTSPGAVGAGSAGPATVADTAKEVSGA